MHMQSQKFIMMTVFNCNYLINNELIMPYCFAFNYDNKQKKFFCQLSASLQILAQSCWMEQNQFTWRPNPTSQVNNHKIPCHMIDINAFDQLSKEFFFRIIIIKEETTKLLMRYENKNINYLHWVLKTQTKRLRK